MRTASLCPEPQQQSSWHCEPSFQILVGALLHHLVVCVLHFGVIFKFFLGKSVFLVWFINGKMVRTEFIYLLWLSLVLNSVSVEKIHAWHLLNAQQIIAFVAWLITTLLYLNSVSWTTKVFSHLIFRATLWSRQSHYYCYTHYTGSKTEV